MKRVHEPQGTVEDLPFDQFQRYRLVADLVRSLGAERLRILDIGGRTALLRRFLPEHDIELVDVLRSDEPGLILGDGAALPFQDGAFDIVCGFDTLEHVPAQGRERFLDECLRVSSRWIVLSGPYSDPEVEEAEALVRGVLAGMGVQSVHLEEHALHGLPDREAVERRLTNGGAQLTTFAHGNLSLWLPAMTLGLYMDVEPTLREAARDMHRFYNRELYASDHGGRAYRHVVFAALAGAPLPAAAPLEPAAASRVAPTRRLIDYVATLGLVERSRATWSAEREQWERDLELWRTERDELAVENRELRVDLDGHRESLDLVSKDLGTHRVELARARSEQSEALITAAALLQQLEEHRTLRNELEAAVEAHQRTRTELETDLREHVEHSHHLEQDLAGHRAVVQELGANLEAHAENLRALTRDRDGLRADRDAQRAAREALEAELKAVLADREAVRRAKDADLAQHRSLVEALSAELKLREGANADLLEAVARRDEFIRDLRRTLESRSANLRRALSGRPSIFGTFEAVADEKPGWRARKV